MEPFKEPAPQAPAHPVHEVLRALSQRAERLTGRWAWAWALTLSAPFLCLTHTHLTPFALVCVGAWALRRRLARARGEGWRARRLDRLAHAQGALECALARLNISSEADELTRLKACEAAARLPSPLAAHLSPLPTRLCLTSLLCSGLLALALPPVSSKLTPQLTSQTQQAQAQQAQAVRREGEGEGERPSEALKRGSEVKNTPKSVLKSVSERAQRADAHGAVRSGSPSSAPPSPSPLAQPQESRRGQTRGFTSVTSHTARARQEARTLSAAHTEEREAQAPSVNITSAHGAGDEGRQAALRSYQLSLTSGAQAEVKGEIKGVKGDEQRPQASSQAPLSASLPPLPLRDEATLSEAEREALRQLRAQLRSAGAP